MFPLVPDGTLLLIDPTAPYGLGDVVVALLPTGQTVAHRVVCRRHGMVLLRGDNNATADPPVSEDQIAGKVVSMLRRGVSVAPESLWFRILTRLILFTMHRIR